MTKRLRRSASRLMAWLPALAGLLAACDHGGTTDPDPRAVNPSAHTLLLYLSGDSPSSASSLTPDLIYNARQCALGMLDTRQPFNLVVYKDTEERGGSLPVLYQLRLNESGQKVDTVVLRQWDADRNSVDPDGMTEVLNMVFTDPRFDTEVKGVCFGSHGLGWVPSSAFVPGQPASAPPSGGTRAAAYFGQDSTHYMEVWDMRAGLERVPHLDYIIFDDCFMANAETAYELRGVVDYIAGCPTEIMAAGLPYRRIVTTLADAQDKTSLPDALRGVVGDFESYYGPEGSYGQYGGTFSLLATAGIATLADRYAAMLADPDVQETLDEWGRYPSTYEYALQHYGRSALGIRYTFYDLQDVAAHLAPGAHADAIAEAMKGVVLAEYHSDRFVPGESIDLAHCHGLSVSLPEFFGMERRALIYLTAYGYTQWGRRMGYGE